jgi:hypothetical protein
VDEITRIIGPSKDDEAAQRKKIPKKHQVMHVTLSN